MEFLDFLIDGLAEDCNMVKGKKPYVEAKDSDGRPDKEVALEAADAYVLRNDSFCNDLFVGMLKSSVVCPEKHESNTFDVATSLQLNVTRDEKRKSERSFSISVVRQTAPSDSAGSSFASVSKLCVSVGIPGIVGSLLAEAAAQAGLPLERCLLAEVSRGRVQDILSDAIKLKDIEASRGLALYELGEESDLGAFQPEGLDVGSEVIVKANFMSNNQKSRVLIEKGTRGTIHKIDNDGDAFVEFDGVEKKQWVLVKNQPRLLNVDAPEQRLHPKDQKAYTLRKLVDAWMCDVERNFSWSAAGAYWLDEMIPQSALACELHFLGASKLTQDRALFGIPLLFTVQRQAITEQGIVKALHTAVSAQLLQRFGPSCETGWKLFRATDKEDLLKTLAPLTAEEQGDGALDLGMCESLSLCVEWEGQMPQHMSDALVATEMLKAGEADLVTLETCFKWYSEEEEVSDFYCTHCKSHVTAKKKVECWSFPPVLVLHLKRFEFSGTGMRGLARGKITAPVQFPLEGLDLTQCCLSDGESFPRQACKRAGEQVVIHGLQSAAGQKLNGLQGTAMWLDASTVRFCVRLHEDDPPDDWKKVKPENLRVVNAESVSAKAPAPVFDLLALSKHIGASSTNWGHYVAYARSSTDGIWRLFDDEQVTEVKAQEVASQHRDAYVLFYLRRDLRPTCWGPPQ
mmetsp:Transcript_25019/g.45878  ORF Transcript_25019/g.45878 Transcript_25019/m.45878 type:complete len:685 (+) Transcript_25019:156-2210(+)